MRNFSQCLRLFQKSDGFNRLEAYLSGRIRPVQLLWLATVAVLVSFLGYRLAQSYGMSGLTGLAVSSVIYFVFVSDTWLQILAWLRVGDNLLKALSGAVLISCAILLAEKAKFFALFKLIGLLAPITATSVTLPQALMQGESGTSSLTSLWESYSKGSSVLLPSPSVVPREAIKNNSVTLAKAAPHSPLYLLQEERFIQSTVRVEEESWVLVLSQLVGETGERWVNVMLPNETGDFVLNDSPTGFLPLERITEAGGRTGSQIAGSSAVVPGSLLRALECSSLRSKLFPRFA